MVYLYVAVLAAGIVTVPLRGPRRRHADLGLAVAILLIFLVDLVSGVLEGEPVWALLRGVVPVGLTVHLAHRATRP
ncbi:MAG: hypothetical protein KC549_07780 [Myxococcales bacterium]|nr:hypothetical protein [Myxococcales bacterium]MCB9548596.1 hypothetical protein [Myxococcales bacterium]